MGVLIVWGRNDRGFTKAGLLPRALELEHGNISLKVSREGF